MAKRKAQQSKTPAVPPAPATALREISRALTDPEAPLLRALGRLQDATATLGLEVRRQRVRDEARAAMRDAEQEAGA